MPVNYIEKEVRSTYNPLVDSLTKIEDAAKHLEEMLAKLDPEQARKKQMKTDLLIMESLRDVLEQQTEMQEMMLAMIQVMKANEPKKVEPGILDRAKMKAV